MKIKMFLCALLVGFPGVLRAESIPNTIGTIPNEAGGAIVFTLTASDKCRKDERVVYTSDSAGKIGNFGCYSLLGDQLLVRYLKDTDAYSYPFANLVLSAEFLEYLVNKEKKKGTKT